MTEQERQHLEDVYSLSEALEAALRAWMAREEKRPLDAAVPGGVAEFAARAVAMVQRELRAEDRDRWRQGWLALLSHRLQVDA
jgi:uncharacterized membrane protein YebE (DUF533 family)